MSKVKDLIGLRFDRLTVISRENNATRGRTRWLCKCDCGKYIVVLGDSLRSGNTKSCGCLNIDKIIERNTSHGKKDTKIYNTWKNMKQRCYNSKNKSYKDYGKREIGICKEWKDNFQLFYEWSIQNGYDEKLTIDRIDNNKDYSPNNCRWVNRKVQNNNTRRNHYIEYNGKQFTLAQLAREYNINYDTLRRRINNYGWNIEKAVNYGLIKDTAEVPDMEEIQE